MEGSIHYGMYAIKGVGREAVDGIVKERQAGGVYHTLEEFLGRLDEKTRNRRVIENLIKAGALDGLEGNRCQKMMVYGKILDSLNSEKKHAMPGQITLFDIAGEEEKTEYQIHLPDVEEFDKQQLLVYEKEVMGMYVSGHPLENDSSLITKNVTAYARDFIWDEESASTLQDRQEVVVAGIITSRKLHFTKKDQTMAFLTIEDLYGAMEVIVFPSVFDKARAILEEDNKVLIRGRVSLEDEKDSKLLAEKILLFEQLPGELWVQFADQAAYETGIRRLEEMLQSAQGSGQNPMGTVAGASGNGNPAAGRDCVVIYIAEGKKVMRMAPQWNVTADSAFLSALCGEFGEENIRLVPGRF